MPRKRKYARRSTRALQPFVVARDPQRPGDSPANVVVDTPIKALEEFGRQLRALRRLSDLESPISHELAEWMAGAIERRLAPEHESLESALRLSEGKGRKRKPATPAEIAKGMAVWELRLQGKSWKEICDSIDWSKKDESTLRGWYQRIEPDVMVSIVAELQRRLLE